MIDLRSSDLGLTVGTGTLQQRCVVGLCLMPLVVSTVRSLRSLLDHPKGGGGGGGGGGGRDGWSSNERSEWLVETTKVTRAQT